MAQDMMGSVVVLNAGRKVYHIVPVHVAYLEQDGDATKIHFTNGETLTVTESIDDVGLKLQGRKK